MLTKNYFYWGNHSFYAPTSLQIRYTNNESIALSEAGQEIGVITRLQKRTVTATWNCSSTTKNEIKTRCMNATTSINCGDGFFECRPRLQACNLVTNSEYADRTDGLWVVTVIFTEI